MKFNNDSKKKYKAIRDVAIKKKKDKRKFFLYIVVLVVFVWSISSYYSKQISLVHYHNAEIHIKKHEYDQALQQLNKSLKYNPANALSYYKRGFLRKIMGDKVELILSDFTKAIKLHPKNLPAYYQRALIHKTQNRINLALRDLKKVTQLDRKHVQAYYRKALIYSQRKGEELVALNNFATAIKLDRKNPELYYQRALLYSKIEAQEDKVLRDLTKAIRLGLKNSYMFHERAKFYEKKQQYDYAVEDLTKAIDLDSGNVEIYYYRGQMYVKLQQHNAAISDFTRVLKIDSKFSKAYLAKGEVYRKQKKYDLAVENWIAAAQTGDHYKHMSPLIPNNIQVAYLSKIIDIKPKLTQAYLDRGRALYRQKQYDIAMQDWITAAKIDGKYNRFFLFIDDEFVIKYLNKFIEIKPLFTEAYRDRAKLHIKHKKYSLAIKDWQKMLELNEYNVVIPTVETFPTQSYELLIKYLSRLIKKRPNLEDAYSKRGFLYRKQKKYNLALQDLTIVPIIQRENAKLYKQTLNLNEQLHKTHVKKFKQFQKKFEQSLKSDDMSRSNTSFKEDLYIKATKNETNNEFKLKFTQKFIKFYPKFVQAYIDRGKIYKQQKKYALAINDWKKVISIVGPSAKLQRWIDTVKDH
ncbi:tetratricopeptide repeat protein [Candidatus Uabimicrobium sp. HlEnr_7]|uniref:tetratricopeptide repeat protein n=1 Tax=Candidatus Uabimicrobium helgolandensis TaxID=3095367 RepID=UPI0035592D5E